MAILVLSPCQLVDATGQGQQSFTISRWERLSAEEKLKKRKIWENRKNTLEYVEIPPFCTPPRNAERDMSLEDKNGEEDQEVMDGLDSKEMRDHEEAEFIALSNLVDNLPDGSSDEALSNLAKSSPSTAMSLTPP